MGRPRNPQSAPRPSRTRAIPGTVAVVVELGPADLDAADAIAADMAREARSVPSRAAAIRRAIRELAARLAPPG